MAFDLVTLQMACESAESALAGLRREQLDDPTPCAEWLVKDLALHIVSATEFFADVIEYGESKNAPLEDCDAGAVPAAFRHRADRLTAALSAEGSMEHRVLLPTGEATGSICLQVATGELFVHSWDLVHATNQPLINASIADTLLESDWIAMCENVRKSEGVFAPNIVIDAGWSSTDRLVAFLGRSPSWDGGGNRH